ncbi:hypothetical protein EZV62_018887 [Acer yangbiense]|uniref:Glycosyl transferase family 28 C-terminal domain-containing protein n=1 Tax=Acer yangbiense TaxID=1000413 RepID=A0A5C7H9N2_9ROSI|nr:hypothetical protein EZV62_018887 [Acer yangbiense]
MTPFPRHLRVRGGRAGGPSRRWPSLPSGGSRSPVTHSKILFIDIINAWATAFCGIRFRLCSRKQFACLPLLFRRGTLSSHLIKSLIKCQTVLRSFDADVVVGTGGYVSFPVVSCCLEGSKLKVQVRGCWETKVRCLEDFVSWQPQGGQRCDGNKKLFFIWQTGVEAFDEMGGLVRNHPRCFCPSSYCFFASNESNWVLAFYGFGTIQLQTSLFQELVQGLVMRSWLQEGNCYSDTITECCGRHQFKNASLLADVAGTRVITEDELDSTTLETAIYEILGNEGLMADMSERALKAANPGASAEIAQHILSLVESSFKKQQRN